MKITKKKNGYIVRCNDGEFAMLEAFVGHALPQAKSLLSGNAQAAYTRRSKAAGGDIMQVDVNNRDA